MLAQVVDPVLCHHHAVAAEIGHALAGHPEVLDDRGDGLQGLVRRQVEGLAAHVPVEDHVQVLVRGHPGEHPFGDGVVAHLSGVAMADSGGEFLKGHVGDREQEVGLMSLFLFGGGPESVGHVDHPGLLERDRVDAARDDEVVPDHDAVPGFFSGPAAHPGSPGTVNREVLRGLVVVGRQVVLGEQVGDHRRFGELAELRLLRLPILAAHGREVAALIPRHIVVRMPLDGHRQMPV